MADGIVIDGKAIASKVKEQLKGRIEALACEGKNVRLDAILVGGDQGALLYAKNQAKASQAIGMKYQLHELPSSTTEVEVLDCVA